MVIKRSTAPGFAGIENSWLTRDNRDAVPARILTWLRDHA